MGRVELEYDPKRDRFRLLAAFELRGGSGLATANVVLDTGTNRSAISEAVAAELGIDLTRLELGDIGGVTAIEKRPRLFEVSVWILGSDVARLTLPEMIVLTEVRRKAKRGRGGLSLWPETRMDAPSLFGMDALRALKGRAVRWGGRDLCGRAPERCGAAG
jgi:hypothetical protein